MSLPKLGKLGRYEMLEEVGRGAMGIVYRAIDPMLGRTVAVKTIVLPPDAAERAEYEARFYQEAKAAGGLAHPNIVTVYDAGNVANTLYMAMEYLEGRELGLLFGAGREAPPERALDIAVQIATGLAYAHERGVVHRDIKPANIMVLQDGTVKITDFGIAKIRSPEVKTQTGKLLGSPRYMSPELFLGKRADQRSDVFSLGVILYELLTGTPPFTGESVSALMYQTVNFMPPSPSTLRDVLPQMLDFILAKTLAKDPDQRYQSARELAHDLRDCLRQLRQARFEAAENDSRTDGRTRNEGKAAKEPVQPSTENTVPLGIPLGNVEALAVPSPTFGISRAFDSLAATQRLAERTGIEAAKKDITTTVKLDRLPVGRLVPGAMRSHSSEANSWSRRETAIFAAGIGIAIVVAWIIATI